MFLPGQFLGKRGRKEAADTTVLFGDNTAEASKGELVGGGAATPARRRMTDDDRLFHDRQALEKRQVLLVSL